MKRVYDFFCNLLPGPSPEESDARRRAQAFVKSILKDELEPIPGSDGMLCLKGVVDLETGDQLDTVIRKVTQPFWQACIDTVNTPGARRRVCAVGTPGIGKTTSIPFLIRMLLLERRGTVVYLVRTEDKDDFYYEFIPGPRAGDPVRVNVYPEQTKRPDIPSLRDPSTYYVVDPGDTSGSCNPPKRFQPKVIIVASPDSKHWGGNDFYKRRNRVVGLLKVFPVWELDELLHTRKALDPDMTDQQVMDRYSQVGGVPRLIFDSDDVLFNAALGNQSRAANLLTLEQAERIATGKFPALPTLDASQPQSALIGFRASEDDRFSTYTVDVIAPRVGARLFRDFMESLWDKLQLPSPANPWLFEAYCRYLLGTNRTFLFERRMGVGKRHPDRTNVERVRLGGCTDILCAGDIVASATKRRLVVFYPMDPRERLIDFVYRDEEGHYHAFQVTLAKEHSANVDHIRTLETTVGEHLRTIEATVGAPFKLSLYYVVPDFRYDDFTTNPADPRALLLARGAAPAPAPECQIYHVPIPNPTD